MTSQQRQRTDALTELADKYNMSSDDRIALFKLYIEAAQLPPGFKAMPEIPDHEMIGAALQDLRFGTSASVWSMMRDRLMEQYRSMWKAAPAPVKKTDSRNTWAEDGSVF